MTRNEITGQKFGRLVAIGSSHKREFWRFKCDCGAEKIIRKASVVRGDTRSCGCLHLERCRAGLNQRKHGDAQVGKVSRLHNIWRGMLKRCADGSQDPRYRARGICVCDQWRDYITFKTWAEANGYSDTLTIDRIDNDGPYSPENCRWATIKEQCRNRRTSRLLTIAGKTQTAAAWAEQYGVSQSTIATRLARGWTAERAVFEKPRVKRRNYAMGEPC
jgi:hypothetical protein